MVRKELEAAGFAGTYEEMALPARFVSKLAVSFAADFCDVEKAREATTVLKGVLKLDDGYCPRVSRTNKLVLQLAAANMEPVSKKKTSSHTTGTPSSSSHSSGSSVLGSSDTESCHADDAESVSPVRRLRRARSACRADDVGFSKFEIFESQLVGEGWQHSAGQQWSARISTKGTFIEVAELKW
jgi:hypothetical protein